MSDTQGTSMEGAERPSIDDRPSGKWCKFCGLPAENVRQLIDGPADNAICNECIDLMYGMVHENAPEIIDLPPKDMAELADAIKAQASRDALLAEAARAAEVVLRNVIWVGGPWEAEFEALKAALRGGGGGNDT